MEFIFSLETFIFLFFIAITAGIVDTLAGVGGLIVLPALILVGIGAAIVWAASVEFLGMMGKGSASIEDILLLFIYLKLGAVVGIYFQTNHMPVRFLIYVAITALTRLLLELVFDWHNIRH